MGHASADDDGGDGRARGALIEVDVAYAASAHELRLTRVRLPCGATVGQAVAACAWASAVLRERADLSLGVGGRRRSAEHVLSAGDRVELLRPLWVEPMQARRLRHAKHARDTSAGKGAKPAQAAQATSTADDQPQSD